MCVKILLNSWSGFIWLHFNLKTMDQGTSKCDRVVLLISQTTNNFWKRNLSHSQTVAFVKTLQNTYTWTTKLVKFLVCAWWGLMLSACTLMLSSLFQSFTFECVILLILNVAEFHFLLDKYRLPTSLNSRQVLLFLVE